MDRLETARRHTARCTAVCRRRCARCAAGIFCTAGVVVFFLIAFLQLIREELREACAYLRSLCADFYEACGQYTELYRHDDLLFTGNAESDDEICADFSVGIDREISAVAVCRQAGFAADIAELCESRQDCRIVYGRHAHFEETGENQRRSRRRDRDISRNRECDFSSEIIHQDQIESNCDLTGDVYFLCAEDRSALAFLVAL